jgi:hypothetical protein
MLFAWLLERSYIYFFFVRTPLDLRWTLPSLFYCNQQSKFIRGSILGRDSIVHLCSTMFATALVAPLPSVRVVLRISVRDQSDSCLEMTTNVHIVRNSSIHGAITPLPHAPAWCIDGQVYLNHSEVESS